MQLTTLYGYNAVLEDALPEPDWRGRDMNWAVEAGTFEVRVGASSEDTRLQSTSTNTFGSPPTNH